MSDTHREQKRASFLWEAKNNPESAADTFMRVVEERDYLKAQKRANRTLDETKERLALARKTLEQVGEMTKQHVHDIERVLGLVSLN